MSESANDSAFVIYGEPSRGRSCGTCKACCTQVPVQDLPEGPKPAGVRCRHLRSKGCSIYPSRPNACRWWSCRWLFDPMAAELRRPDLAGYIVDPMLDTVILDGRPVEALQVWVDPKRREAHRDPALRAYLAAIAERYRLPAIVRWGSGDGLVLFAPCLTVDRRWSELGGSLVTEDGLRARLAEIDPAGRHPSLRLTAHSMAPDPGDDPMDDEEEDEEEDDAELVDPESAEGKLAFLIGVVLSRSPLNQPLRWEHAAILIEGLRENGFTITPPPPPPEMDEATLRAHLLQLDRDYNNGPAEPPEKSRFDLLLEALLDPVKGPVKP